MREQFIRWFHAWIALVVLAAAGCGGQRYPLAPVSGRVTLDSVPLADARVGFEPIRQGDQLDAGPGSYATTDAEGRYSLVCLDGRKGAVVGRHRVWIRTYRGVPGPNGSIVTKTPERVPARYNAETKLTFTVEAEGTTAADFDLTTK